MQGDRSGLFGVLERAAAYRLVLLIVAAMALPWLVFAADRAAAQGRVLRGVWVGPVALAGLDRDAARRALATWEARLQQRPLTVRVGNGLVTVDPREVGFALDLDATLERVLGAGRGATGGLGWWLGTSTRSVDIAPAVRLEPRATDRVLTKLERSGLVDLPFDGSVVVVNGKPQAVYPRRGRVVDREVARARIAAALASEHRGVVELPLADAAPRLDRAAVDAAVRVAARLVAGPVRLIAPDSADELTLEAADLGAALSTRSRQRPRPYLEIYFDETRLASKLDPLRKRLEREPVAATFAVDDKNAVHLVPDQPGMHLDPRLFADAVLYAAAAPGRRGLLPLDRAARAEVTARDLEALGIKELVSQFTTYHPCCRPRVENIHRIADLMDGVIVKPGVTFSVNEHVGPRTQKNGFVPAPTIEEGEMVDSLGGGISQFATTLFNAVLRGGYTIVERQPHSYYFSRYPMGHEATLSYPSPDIKFTNDTKAGLLIKCEYGETFIRVKVFGDQEGRKVITHVGPRTDITRPRVEYVANESLEPDDEEVLERGQIGWTVLVSRTVEYADGTKKAEQRKVTYNPRVRRLEVHPCRIPEGEEGYTGKPCPVPEDEAAGEDAAPGEALDAIDPDSPLDEGF